MPILWLLKLTKFSINLRIHCVVFLQVNPNVSFTCTGPSIPCHHVWWQFTFEHARFFTITSLQLRDVCTIMCFVLADAAWESFADKKEVTSANQEHMIQKVLQNLHWERKPRGGGRGEEDDWDRSRRRRAMVVPCALTNGPLSPFAHIPTFTNVSIYDMTRC